jgi:hypothetical protein
MLGILHYYICVAAGAAADTGTWHGMQASLPCTATEKGADTGTRHGLSCDLSVGGDSPRAGASTLHASRYRVATGCGRVMR